MKAPINRSERSALLTRVVERHDVPRWLFTTLLGQFIKKNGSLEGAEQYLESKADEYAALTRQINDLAQSGDREALHTLLRHLDEGKLDLVDEGLEKLEVDLDAKVSGLAKWSATSLFNRAEISYLAGNRDEALKLYDAAVGMSAPADEVTLKWQVRAAEVATETGERLGDVEFLSQAVKRWEGLLANTNLSGSLDRVSCNIGLGRAWLALGKLQANPEFLDRAAEAFKYAVERLSQKDQPQLWIRAQRHLVATLRAIGQRHTDNQAPSEAIAVLNMALSSEAASNYPLEKANLYDELARIFMELGDLETDTRALHNAVFALRAALAIRTPEEHPLDWAATVNNLGNALRSLGMREQESALLEESISAYRTALQIYSRDQLPLEWASVQNNLGHALAERSQLPGSGDSLEAAVAAYRSALAVNTHERSPLGWAVTQNNLAQVLQTLGSRQGDIEILNQAAVGHRAALQIFSRFNLRYEWAMTKSNLASTLLSIASVTSDCPTAQEAVVNFTDALATFVQLSAERQRLLTARKLQAAQELRDQLCH